MNVAQEAVANAAKKAGFSLYFGDTIVRVCDKCGATAEYSNIDTLDFSHECQAKPMAFTPGFVPVDTDRFSFAHRGVSVDLFLTGGVWLCRIIQLNMYAKFDKGTSAADMRARLIEVIEANTPDYMLLPEGRTALDWISACAKNTTEARPVPFCGELNADDASDATPGCYGL